MKYLFILLALLFVKPETTTKSFRDQQKNYTRVLEAYGSKEKSIAKNLAGHGIKRDSMALYIRAFKTEKILELWARNNSDSIYKLVKEMPICEISGEIGPKRRSQDLQVPEGFYYICELNPYSKYYLSMKINYPNASDSIRGVKGKLGNLIYIHGGCQSSGCISVDDEKIKELYVYCIEAYNSGQKKIPVIIYPAKLEDSKFARLNSAYSKNKDKISLWTDLKKSYDLFKLMKVPPTVKYMSDGTHEISISPEAETHSVNIVSPVLIQGAH
jgi:murein L,D-transpeptidase YafK